MHPSSPPSFRRMSTGPQARVLNARGSNARRWLPLLVAWTLCLLMGVLAGCSKPSDPAARAPETGVASGVVGQSNSQTGAGVDGGVTPHAVVGSSAPEASTVASQATTTGEAAAEREDEGPSRRAFVGSERCQDCHAKKVKAWSTDWHAKALSPAVPGKVVGKYKNTHFAGSSNEAWMKQSKSQYVMRTADNFGVIDDFPVSWVIGGKRMQDSVTVFEDGRWQVLPVYFHVTGKGEWVDYNEKKQGVVGPEHPFFWTNFRRTVNRECLDCHATGVKVSYDHEAHHWSTDMADASVACEACHGPGARHSETKETTDIFHPSKASPELSLEMCGSCHGPRNPLFPILDHQHRFQPGDRYDDHFQALVVVDGKERSGEYFADGRPSSSSFEYQALIQSQCYLKGKATCLSCHTGPHEPHGPNELRPAAAFASDARKAGRSAAEVAAIAATPIEEVGCRSCHAQIFADRSGHSHHKGKAGQSCVSCHMPKVVTGVLDHFADHAIGVPVPENTVRHHIESACDVCHAKEGPERMVKAMAEWWPGGKGRVRRILLADAFDESSAASSLSALQAVLRDESEATILRGTAATLIAQRFPQETLKAVAPWVGHTDPLLRYRMLEALGFANAKAGADLVASRAQDPAMPVRYMAAVVLGMFEDARSGPLLEKLSREPSTRGLEQPHVMRGMALARAGKFDEAEEEVGRAIQIMPYNTSALVMMADLAARHQDWDQVKHWLDQALFFDPQNSAAKNRLARLSAPAEVPAQP